jgi:transposase InsO family protein
VQENLALKTKLDAIVAEQTLVAKTIKIFGFVIQYRRLPSAETKSEMIAEISAAAKTLPLERCLSVIGFSMARYRHWIKRQVHCLLEDASSCPRFTPTQITRPEVENIKTLYTSKDFAHFSKTSLSWFAKKAGVVFATVTTWSRIIRQLGLGRNLVRVYPPRPKIGIRASAPGKIWHLDYTILRLQDGSKVFIQCVLDNYSRYVLAWKVTANYGGLQTKELLITALAKAKSLGLELIPKVFVDSGVENLNEHVDGLVETNRIARTVAQIDVEFSNSTIEMLFHRAKHRYLFTITLNNFEAVVRGPDFFFTETNTRIPHSALKGATPEVAIAGKWYKETVALLQSCIEAARADRKAFNKSARCLPCLA